MFDIQEHLKNLPDKPGVYIMKNDKKDIIYVGKSVSLKNRVRQYFQNSKNHPPKVRAMVSNVAEFEYIITANELEALILECNLIKENRPKYNILLKDDKNYPYIKITNEKFPRIMFTRRVLKDKAKYFGPYTSAFAVRETIDVIRRMFPIRSCNIDLDKKHGVRECLYYHIGKCSAPCTGKITYSEYKKIYKDIINFLDGRQDELIKLLEEDMVKAANELKFERAALLRDQINAINKLNEKQRVLNLGIDDIDVVAMSIMGDYACIQIFFVRKGKLIDRDYNIFNGIKAMEEEQIMSDYLKQYYAGVSFIPREIIIQKEIADKDLIEKWLTGKKISRVKLTRPQKGEKKQLVDMVQKNAAETLVKYLKTDTDEQVVTDRSLIELKDLMVLDKAPYRIEAFDVSNTQGHESVASMVVFEDGLPRKRDYRKFKIKSVEGPNDYRSMQEVIERRFNHALKEADGELDDGGKFSKMPDLIMIDGGLGHVNAVTDILNELKIDIPICGMVKDSRHRTRGLIYKGGEIDMPKGSKSFRLVTRIQDEAHRFAITYHKQLRNKATTKSVLDDIIGIGEVRKKALLKYFKNIDLIKNAPVEKLCEVKGMNKKSAKAVYNFFHM